MNGIFGTVRPANIDPIKDVDIFYYYRPSRSTSDSSFPGFKRLDSSNLIKEKLSDGASNNLIELDGMYNLRLPLDVFSKKGVYTIYIKPKEYITEIYDSSILYAFPDTRGLVFEKKNIGNINDLSGYRIEYFEDRKTNKRKEMTRIITSSSPCTSIRTASNDTHPQTLRYVLGDSSSGLIFCTVTPSLAMSHNSNYLPEIGEGREEVAIINTKFNPVMFEIELVDNDINTIATMVSGTQIRDLDNGTITTFNDDNEKFSVHEYYTFKNKLGDPLYDIKKKNNTLNGTDYNSIME